MDQDKGPYSKEGHGVGYKAEEDLEHLKEVLHHKAAHPFGEQLLLPPADLAQGFFGKHQEQGNYKEGNDVQRGENVDPQRHRSHYGEQHRQVKDQAGQAVVGEEDPFPILSAQPQQDIEADGYDDDNGAHAYRCQQQEVGVAAFHHLDQVGPSEQGLMDGDQQFFKAEHRAVQEAEHHGGKADPGHDAANGHPLLFVQEKAQQGDHKPLAQVAEHDAEKQDIGKGHVGGRIQVLIGGKPVHIHEHFKGLHKGQIAKAHRHREPGLLPGVLQGHRHLVQAGKGLFKGGCLLAGDIPQHHKVPLHRGGLVPQLKGFAQKAELGVKLLDTLLFPGSDAADLLPDAFQHLLLPLEVLLDKVDGLLGGAVGVVRHPDPLEVEGLEQAVDLLGVGDSAGVKAPVIGAVLPKGEEDKGPVAVAAQLLVAVQGQPPKAHLDVLTGEEAVKVQLHAGKVLQPPQGGFVGFDQLLGSPLF